MRNFTHKQTCIFSVLFFIVGMTSGYVLFGTSNEAEQTTHHAVVQEEQPHAHLPHNNQQPVPSHDTSVHREATSQSTALPDYIRHSLTSAGLPGNMPSKDEWEAFLEKTMVKNIHTIEQQYDFNLLRSFIRDKGVLPPDDFFTKFGHDFTQNTEQNRSIVVAGIKSLSLENIKQLVDKGFNLAELDDPTNSSDCYRLLNYAMGTINAPEKVQYLLEQGLSFDKGEHYLITALNAAQKNNISKDLLRTILHNTDPNGVEPNGRGVFFRAIECAESKEVIDYFIENGYHFSEETRRDNPLITACTNKHVTPDQYQKLIDIAGTPDFSSKQGITPLMTAVFMNRPEFVKVLLANGANRHLRGTLNGMDVYDYLKLAQSRNKYTPQEAEEMARLLQQ